MTSSSLDCDLVANIIPCMQTVNWIQLAIIVIAIGLVIAALEILTARVVMCLIAVAACAWLFLRSWL
jgi:hypothetical protein